MKTIKTFSFVSPDSRYSICEKKFNFLIQELEDSRLSFRYSMNVIFSCDVETGESVKILQCKIILEKGMITKILSKLL